MPRRTSLLRNENAFADEPQINFGWFICWFSTMLKTLSAQILWLLITPYLYLAALAVCGCPKWTSEN